MSNMDFSNRPIKRRIDYQQILALKDYGFGQNKETIIVLCGPNPEETIKLYDGMYKHLILVEKDDKTFEKIKYNTFPENVVLFKEDIFNVITVYKEIITGIDFDICGVFCTEEYDSMLKAVNELTQNKIFVRLNSSTRINDGDATIDFFYKKLSEDLQKDLDFEITKENKIGYNDYNSAPMRRYQLVLERKEDIENIFFKRETKTKFTLNYSINSNEIISKELEELRETIKHYGAPSRRRNGYPLEVRKRILNYIKEYNYSNSKAANKLGISYITLNKWTNEPYNYTKSDQESKPESMQI